MDIETMKESMTKQDKVIEGLNREIDTRAGDNKVLLGDIEVLKLK